LKKGKLIAAGDVNEILANDDIVELGAPDMEKLRNIISRLTGYNDIKEHDNLLQLFYPVGTTNLENINRYCFENGVVLNYMQLKKKSLESKFFELTN
jgi:ABC-type multidrug transport system ATPase subunit